MQVLLRGSLSYRVPGPFLVKGLSINISRNGEFPLKLHIYLIMHGRPVKCIGEL